MQLGQGTLKSVKKITLKNSSESFHIKHGRIQGGGGGGLEPPVKSQVAIGFFRNSGMNIHQVVGPTASRGRSIWPSEKYVEKKKKFLGWSDPLTKFSGSVHVRD